MSLHFLLLNDFIQFYDPQYRSFIHLHDPQICSPTIINENVNEEFPITVIQDFLFKLWRCRRVVKNIIHKNVLSFQRRFKSSTKTYIMNVILSFGSYSDFIFTII